MTKVKPLEAVKHFLSRHLDRTAPVILALSGGPDSLALLALLLQYHRDVGVDLHVAHVDHGWRSESGGEARCLEELVGSYGIPFHVHVLETASGSNLEGDARDQRLAYFGKLSDTLGAQAVLTAHHADDQAETTLKRLCEGYGLPFLGGMQPIAVVGGVTLWRPLLFCSKASLVPYAHQLSVDPVEDRTNRDQRFLRARCREAILPDLSRSFGKEVTAPLSRVASEAVELRQHLDMCIAPPPRKGNTRVLRKLGLHHS